MWFHIVDDEPELREMMRTLITSEGYKAATFKNAEAYLDFFHSPKYIKPVAMIVDNHMAGMNGVELVRYVRKRSPLQRVVMTTAIPADTEEIKSLLCYELPKPFTYRQLKTMLQGMVSCMEAHDKPGGHFDQGLCQFGLEHKCPFTDTG